MWYNVWLIPDCAIDWPTTQQLQVRAELSEGQPRARWIRQTPEAVGRVFWCIVTTLSLITSYVQLSLLAMCISNVLYSWWVWTLLVSYELVTCTYPPLHLNVIKIQTVFVVIKINIASVFTADVSNKFGSHANDVEARRASSHTDSSVLLRVLFHKYGPRNRN